MRLAVVLVMALLWPRHLAAAPVPVHFAEGVTHGFLVLRTVNDVVLARGDLSQIERGGAVESRMDFRFKDGSVLFATPLGRMPADYHAWIMTDGAPAFVKFEGPLYPTGPIWRIELATPRLA